MDFSKLPQVNADVIKSLLSQMNRDTGNNGATLETFIDKNFELLQEENPAIVELLLKVMIAAPHATEAIIVAGVGVYKALKNQLEVNSLESNFN